MHTTSVYRLINYSSFLVESDWFAIRISLGERPVELSTDNCDANWGKKNITLRCSPPSSFSGCRCTTSSALSLAFVPRQKPVKTDVTREYGDRGFTMETGARDASKKGDHRGNGPDVGADHAGRRACKGGFRQFFTIRSAATYAP